MSHPRVLLRVTAARVEVEDALPRDHLRAFGPRVPQCRELAHACRLLCGEVAELGAVELHRVQLPLAAEAAHELPVADADGGVAGVLPEERMRLDALPGQR